MTNRSKLNVRAAMVLLLGPHFQYKTNKELAARCGENPLQLAKNFKEVTGMKISEFVKADHLNRARNMIVKGTTVKEAAFWCLFLLILCSSCNKYLDAGQPSESAVAHWYINDSSYTLNNRNINFNKNVFYAFLDSANYVKVTFSTPPVKDCSLLIANIQGDTLALDSSTCYIQFGNTLAPGSSTYIPVNLTRDSVYITYNPGGIPMLSCNFPSLYASNGIDTTLVGGLISLSL